MTDTATEASTEAVAEPVVDVQDLGQFVALLQDWHKKQVATMKHMLDIPDGTEVLVEGEAPMTLTGDVLRGFQMGVNLSLTHLGELPFNAEFVDPDATKH